MKSLGLITQFKSKFAKYFDTIFVYVVAIIVVNLGK